MKIFSKWKILMTVGIIFILVVFIIGFFGKNKNSQPYDERNVIKTKEKTDFKEAKPEIPSPKRTTFFFGGDLMFDRYVNHSFKDIGFDKIFTELDQELFERDVVLANLEGPISDKPTNDDYRSGSMVFNMPKECIDGLKFIKINGVTLGNNHTLNAGASGFETTMRLLREAGIKYGGYQNGFDEGSVIRYETEIPISIISYNNLSYTDIEKVSLSVQSEKALGRFVIVFPHWGNEYALKHNLYQETTGHKFIDSGADMVIGNHPHVVQDVEVYKNRPIFYSLGNFVFDQLFSPETQEGILLTGEIVDKKLTIKINPIKGKNMKLRMMNEEEKAILLKRINNNGDSLSFVLSE